MERDREQQFRWSGQLHLHKHRWTGATLLFDSRYGGTNTTVAVAPTIDSQPQDQPAAVGQGALFSVTASGSAPLLYQWYFNTNTLVLDATNSSHLISSVTSNDAGGYSVVIANAAGSVTSRVAQLTIAAAPTNGNWSRRAAG